jgi:hypothetical protein
MNCCHAWHFEGSLLPEHAGEPEMNWVLSCSEKLFAILEPVAPTWPVR